MPDGKEKGSHHGREKEVFTGFLYLAVILDLYSHKVIGWALSQHIDTELTLADESRGGL